MLRFVKGEKYYKMCSLMCVNDREADEAAKTVLLSRDAVDKIKYYMLDTK